MTNATINQKLALEMAMQDVLDNMEELALDYGFACDTAEFEILAIEPTPVPNEYCGASSSAALRSPFTADIQPLTRSRHVA